MSVFSEFEEIDLEGDTFAINSLQSPASYNLRAKILKKKTQIPILNKTTSNPNTFEYNELLKQVNMNIKYKIDSNFVKTPSPRANARDTVQRLLFNYQLSENRKSFLRKQKEINELQSCTFSPLIYNARFSNNSDKVLKRNTKNKKQRIDEFGMNESVKDKIKIFREPSKTSPKQRKLLKNNNKQAQNHSSEHRKITNDKNSLYKDKTRPPIPKAK
ncbi:hypothetical protein SteCoe_19825 [Stentor coeruleus]|uniref:Uncharacterized protein n=1 Tax=Stentor coeruleus TaxID=5963 RepID=A0A1R2BTC9_9CILI|nr:hypothetical protein SteCoe_19825 [Stentor coeruleus]